MIYRLTLLPSRQLTSTCGNNQCMLIKTFLEVQKLYFMRILISGWKPKARRGKAACDRIDKVRYNEVPYFN